MRDFTETVIKTEGEFNLVETPETGALTIRHVPCDEYCKMTVYDEETEHPYMDLPCRCGVCGIDAPKRLYDTRQLLYGKRNR